jgi:collagenase-like PrtC family protease
VANWAHFSLFSRPPEALIADLTFNVLNSQAAFFLHEAGCQGVILSLENDRANLQDLLPAIQALNPLLTVYGRPPLFTSRLKIKARPGEVLRGDGEEGLDHHGEAGLTLIRPLRPLCLLEYLKELRDLGVRGFVMDLRRDRPKPERVRSLVEAFRRERCPESSTTFNYLRRLV